MSFPPRLVAPAGTPRPTLVQPESGLAYASGVPAPHRSTIGSRGFGSLSAGAVHLPHAASFSAGPRSLAPNPYSSRVPRDPFLAADFAGHGGPISDLPAGAGRAFHSGAMIERFSTQAAAERQRAIWLRDPTITAVTVTHIFVNIFETPAGVRLERHHSVRVGRCDVEQWELSALGRPLGRPHSFLPTIDSLHRPGEAVLEPSPHRSYR